MKIKSTNDLSALKEKIEKEKSELSKKTQVIVYQGTCGFASGAREVLEALKKELHAKNLTDVAVLEHSCMGCCYLEPYMSVTDPKGAYTLYGYLTPEKVKQIVGTHLMGEEVVQEYMVDINMPFFSRQEKRITELLGKINPFKIEDYIFHDGYQGLSKALEMKQVDVIEEVKHSGLRGRGGAGFPTGVKWNFAYNTESNQKYMVCNADEGDPGAYMNRAELEGNPHAVLEGMAIGGYAIGANKGYIYVRAEYPLAVEILNAAIAQARAYGFLGEGILGTSFEFDIELFLGSGAFVCGEETALLASLEQKRGNPRPRPPFPATQGLFGKPTVINNVGTLSNLPLIMCKGAEWWGSIGSESTKGTKVFSLTGQIAQSGLIEVPMGISLGEVVFDLGGGIAGGKKFKAVQLGGPSGGCVPAEYLNIPIDYESLQDIGCIMGSGAMVVLDQDACMVDTARFFLEFDADESCGQCVPCRRGLPLMTHILEKITEGNGEIKDLETLKDIATGMQKTSLCALGQTAASPTLSTIRHFREEYEAHIIEKRCPAGVCAALFKTKCRNACPINQDIPVCMALARKGELEEAYKVIKQTNPLPLVLGRVCHHPCENKCDRGKLDEPLAIREVKRWVADYAYENNIEYRPPKRAQRKEKIAIVGSGPAGLAAAYDLCIQGFGVTVFEALPVAGGMLAVGIPEYRLPKKFLEHDIEQIRKMGVEIRLNTPIQNIDDLFAQDYKAIFLAVGAHGERSMNIPGEELQGVFRGTEFLKDLNSGQSVDLGKKVIVVGGGNNAVDCARVARRMGAEVTILYRREKHDMPAISEDIEAADKEGVHIDCLSVPVEIIGNGRVEKIKCRRMELEEFDASCRRIPCDLKDSEYIIQGDSLIESIGQFPETELLSVRTTRGGKLDVDSLSLATDRDGVFGGGDAVTGPLTVVDAMAHGQRAACSIRRYLDGESLEAVPTRADPEKYHIPFAPEEEEYEEKHRVRVTEADLKVRTGTFEETLKTYSKEEAMQEAGRCLRCDARR
ncbi:MAG: FAD-dependent oxidoreductase [Deltaproteobacteria bacterium]|nr:FAD-dependent oxidoreductase [Deltaproteobacteria bacterium]